MTTVRAAGGVVWRAGADGRPVVCLVHRPRYDDWSIPKGKLDKGESELAAAVREIAEETGSVVTVSRRLTGVSYRYDGIDKTVAYWTMRHRAGDFTASDEVDELVWLPVPDAAARVDHDADREVLADFAALPPPDSVVLLVRHAKAGKRSEWSGDDAQRPLDGTGAAQAERLVPFLASFAPDRVLSASPLRCVQTVTPFARSIGAQVTVDPSFSDDGHAADPHLTDAALLALARPGSVTVVASQGGAIPALVASLAPWHAHTDTRKGAVWALSFVDGSVVAADYYPDAARE